jgi:hypothetical protein
MNLKYIFNNLSKKDKILLYIMIPILFGFFIFTIDKYIAAPYLIKLEDQIATIQENNKKIHFKKNIINEVEILKYIDNIALKHNIKLTTTKIDKKLLDIEADGKFQNIMTFVKIIRKNGKIKKLSLIKQDKSTVLLNCLIIIKNLKSQKQIIANNIPNPFKISSEHISELKLFAVIGEYASINNVWYKVGDKVGKYTIKTIDRNSVKLNSKDQYITLKLIVKFGIEFSRAIDK